MELVFNLAKIIFAAAANYEFELLSFNGKYQFFRKCYFDLMHVKYGDSFYMGHHIEVRNRGNLILGNRCCIGSYSRIWNYAPIAIGDDFLTAGCLTLNSGTHDPLTLNPEAAEIKIGSRVWCGINVTIIGGVNIGDDVVIGAGSLVTRDIPGGCIAAGVPAKKLKELDRTDIKIWRPFGWNQTL